MKIQILTLGIKNKALLEQGLEMARIYASTEGYNFEYTFKEVTKKFNTTSYELKNIINGVEVKETKTYINPDEILNSGDTTNKIICLMVGNDTVLPYPTNPYHHSININGCTPIQIPEKWYGEFAQVLCDYFLHEICHAGFYFAGKKDITHDQQTFPEWQSKSQHEYYLSLLKVLKPNLETVISPPPSTDTPMPTLYYRSTFKEAVKELQRILGITIDGDFGPKTLAAVKAFQTSHGLKADGVVGPKTWIELKKKPQ